jgi:NADPH:quinone reductase-like Zn-dependent oxidoreductase
MKVVCFYEHGDNEVIRYSDVPDPTPGGGEVLVQVKACALNHLDIWVRRGWPGLKLPMPHWGGADIAGVVAAVGEGVSGWEAGQRVVADPGINVVEDEFTRCGEDSMSPGYHILGEQLRGGHGEFAVVPARNLVVLPPHIDFAEGAAPLLVTLTAWRMLIHRAKLRAGETVLVVGAGGGANSMAIQVAKLAGAKVFVVASNAAKAERAMKLGADVVIDRSIADWPKEVIKMTQKRGVDVVVDNVGRATLSDSMKVAARGGRIVIIGNTSGPITELDIRYIFGKQISLIGSTMGTHRDFRDVTALLWAGRLGPVIDRVMPLSDGREAYALLESGDHFGKIVLVP